MNPPRPRHAAGAQSQSRLRRATQGWLAAQALLLAACAGAGGGAGRSGELPAFYTPAPAELAGPPGSIIRHEALPGLVVPEGTAYRLLYRSTDPRDRPIAVSAVLVVPAAPAPAGGRPVVAWDHPTSGVVRRCAPSLSPDVPKTIQGLADLIARGYAVVATDYPGLGTPGPHPYLTGASEGRAVLDAVRAAHAFAPAQAGTRFVVWGHSQGGHASLFAAALAQDYAPELQLQGVAVAAPATRLRALLHTVPGTTMNASMVAMLLHSWSRVLGASLADMVPEADIPHVERLAATCIPPPWSGAEQPVLEPDPDLSFTILQDIAAIPPWGPFVTANTPGALPPAIPVFLAQGEADTTIAPALTAAYMSRLCAAGSWVRMVTLPGVDHRFIAREAAPLAARWIGDRFAGRPAPDDCPPPVR
ncbi:alpha/beta fold hydrolase [Pseudothauera rhizosphaerae]|uniref:Alpha/beta fold hydrolase n=1 Tax=Pseudothauera rhizosphaerae TaxID=2565932 RepID=A0A4V3WAJ9_9RHOO|nr:alpha/beta fold hydrolase [Pseudothauera rhizosphaerae]THF59301.1 alpha/beta fold hydrolase [Pseudothauera rhizosphaerae]